MSIREILKGKLTKEDFHKRLEENYQFSDSYSTALAKLNSHRSTANTTHAMSDASLLSTVLKDYRNTTHWWAVREQMRLDSKVYEVSKALEYVNLHFPVFAHISVVDNTKVAYTVDAQGGEADRQISLSPGKLFSRLFPLYTDDVIRQMTELHNAEACAVVEFLEGAEIVKAYKEFSEGVGACMTKSHFNAALHPAEVYARSPNVRLAVLRGAKDATVISRAIVRTDKKIFVRVYPAKSVLERKLTDMGYVAGSWIDQEFPAIFCNSNREEVVPSEAVADSAGTFKVLMPYLDTNNGRNDESIYLAIVGNSVRVIKRQSYRNADMPSTSSGSSTAGYALLPDITDKVVQSCGLTGETYDIFSGKMTLKYWLNGQTVKILEKNLPSNAKPTGVVADGQVKEVWVPAGTPTFTHDPLGVSVVDTVEHRKALGYYLLSTRRYPGELTYARASEAVPEFVVNADGKFEFTGEYVRKADTDVLLVTTGNVKGMTAEGHYEDEDFTTLSGLKLSRFVSTGVVAVELRVHKDTLPTAKTKVHSRKRGETVWAADSIPIVKTTFGRRSVVVGYHAVIRLYAEAYEFLSNISQETVMGWTYNSLTLKDTPEVVEMQKRIDAQFLETMFAYEDVSTTGRRVSLLSRLFCAEADVFLRSGLPELYSCMFTTTRTKLSTLSFASYKRYCELIVGSSDIRSNANGQKFLKKIAEAELRAMAETEAVEAPHYLREIEQVEPVVQVLEVTTPATETTEQVEAVAAT